MSDALRHTPEGRTAPGSGAMTAEQDEALAALAELERLFSKWGKLTLLSSLQAIDSLTDDLAAASERIARLEEALRPFAGVGQFLFARDLPNDTPVVNLRGINGRRGALTRGDFKAAHTASLSPAGLANDE